MESNCAECSHCTSLYVYTRLHVAVSAAMFLTAGMHLCAVSTNVHMVRR